MGNRYCICLRLAMLLLFKVHIVAILVTDILAQDFTCSYDPGAEETGSDYFLHDNDPRKWTNNEVPYFFDQGAHHEDQEFVEQQMKVIEAKVPCIKFTKISEDNINSRKYLKIIIGNRPNRCGNGGAVTTRWFYAQVTLQIANRLEPKRCKGAKNFVLHELMHVFGIAHTQKRSDSDQYITVNKNCIFPSAWAQYKPLGNYPDLSFRSEVPYKCDSIMHYTPKHYSNGCPTMEPKNSRDCQFQQRPDGPVPPEDWLMLAKQIKCAVAGGGSGSGAGEGAGPECKDNEFGCDSWEWHWE